jgi:hypothetical protein
MDSARVVYWGTVCLKDTGAPFDVILVYHPAFSITEVVCADPLSGAQAQRLYLNYAEICVQFLLRPDKKESSRHDIISSRETPPNNQGTGTGMVWNPQLSLFILDQIELQNGCTGVQSSDPILTCCCSFNAACSRPNGLAPYLYNGCAGAELQRPGGRQGGRLHTPTSTNPNTDKSHPAVDTMIETLAARASASFRGLQQTFSALGRNEDGSVRTPASSAKRRGMLSRLSTALGLTTEESGGNNNADATIIQSLLQSHEGLASSSRSMNYAGNATDPEAAGRHRAYQEIAAATAEAQTRNNFSVLQGLRRVFSRSRTAPAIATARDSHSPLSRPKKPHPASLTHARIWSGFLIGVDGRVAPGS